MPRMPLEHLGILKVKSCFCLWFKSNYSSSYTLSFIVPITLHTGKYASLDVVSGKTYLLQLINAALNNNHFFQIANHTMTVVATDGEYVKPFNTTQVVLSPGQSLDVLVTANQPKGKGNHNDFHFGNCLSILS